MYKEYAVKMFGYFEEISQCAKRLKRFCSEICSSTFNQLIRQLDNNTKETVLPVKDKHK